MRSGKELVRKTGMWLIETDPQEPEDLNAQVAALVRRLTPDIGEWQALSREFAVDLYCGLFMESTNDGMVLSPLMLEALGARGIELQLQLYAPLTEAAADPVA